MNDDAQGTGQSEPAPHEHARSLRQAAYLTAGLGVAHALLFLLAFLLVTTVPAPSAPDAEISEFYSSAEKRRVIVAGLYVMPFAGIALLWFIVALRAWVSGTIRRENVLLSNVQLVSGIIYIAMFFAAAGASSVMAASVEFSDASIEPELARQFPQYGSTMFFVFALRMAAVFVFTTSTIGRTSGVLPRWFAFTGYGVGLFLLLSGTFYRWFVLVFPIWVLVLGILLFLRARQIPADAVIGQVSETPAVRPAG